jgi:5-methylcytosine-specific restriction protein B
MARYTEHDRQDIDATIGLWKERCLLADRSLVFEDRDGVWTLENVGDLYARFIENPYEGAEGGGTFFSKWEHQLDGASDSVRLLGAELLLVHFLFASSVTYRGKLDAVQACLQPIDLTLPEDSIPVRALHQRIGHPGIGFNTRRDVQVAYLIDFSRRIKHLPQEQRGPFLDDPWALRDFADETDQPIREMRHILLHLLRPDEFERISSGSHKREIASAFSSLLDEDSPADLDERLYAIRKKLEEHLPKGNTPKGMVDYYSPPLRGVWESTGGGDGEGATDLETLLWKKQIVLYGPPGTSKTFEARRVAEALIRRAALATWGIRDFLERADEVEAAVRGNLEWAQLHPGFGYEEFIRGLRLEGDETRYEPGLLPRLVERMNKQGEQRLPTVLVLDEINRTDLSRMLGEAFSLLERDKRGTVVNLPGANPGEEEPTLTVPEDLYVVGTMNEIDQSVESLDFALRRRFMWRECRFERDTLIEMVRTRWPQDVRKFEADDAADQLERFADRAVALNDGIEGSPELGRQYQIGHAYFADIAFFIGTWVRARKSRPPRGTYLWTAAGRAQPPLNDLWARSLRPLLEQYLAASDIREDELARLEATFKAA